ncbi:tautomerase family protein [Bradyrhizobium forestalis]|uniref:tautomerase family protein n=1 Tax=Bradyrhizobium forestalis TaxID=1419263 RepID=UPI0011AEDEC2|nr:tautomerase family protein [Bradyrhizobium forestalis]
MMVRVYLGVHFFTFFRQRARRIGRSLVPAACLRRLCLGDLNRGEFASSEAVIMIIGISNASPDEKVATGIARFHVADLIEGWSDGELRKLLDLTHEVLVETLHVPARDRYQVVHLHPRSCVAAFDTGLGFERTEKLVILQLTSRPRERR